MCLHSTHVPLTALTTIRAIHHPMPGAAAVSECGVQGQVLPACRARALPCVGRDSPLDEADLPPALSPCVFFLTPSHAILTLLAPGEGHASSAGLFFPERDAVFADLAAEGDAEPAAPLTTADPLEGDAFSDHWDRGRWSSRSSLSLIHI